MRRAHSIRVVACVLAVATTAGAQAPPSSPPSTASPRAAAGQPPAPLGKSLTGPAKEAYEAARLLAVNNDFAGAVTKFTQAYQIARDPRLLFDMAVCEKNLRHYARTQALLTQYLDDGDALLTPENRAAANGALDVIKGLVGAVRVTANEAGATVLLDGETIGTTPLAAAKPIDLGKHALTVRKEGFVAVDKAFETAGGAETSIDVTLKPEVHIAKLVVMVESAATVIVDGAVAGAGRYDGQLPPGPHEVRVTESGKIAYHTTIDLRDGETRTVQVTLENERRSIVPWVIGGAVVAVGAAVGGYFLFKPSDTTTPPPPGKLGSVSFASFVR